VHSSTQKMKERLPHLRFYLFLATELNSLQVSRLIRERRRINVVDICLVASYDDVFVSCCFHVLYNSAYYLIKSVILFATSAKSLPTTSGSPPNRSYHSWVLSVPSSPCPRGGCSASTYPVLNLSSQLHTS
jgi:hypothetical protein